MPTTIKKYSNRRLYDTEDSCYITLEQLAEKVRQGTDVRVVDAKSGADLTQATLMQIIIDGRGAAALLPVPLLTQLLRMQDEALAEFFGNFLSFAMDLYLSAKRGAQAMSPYVPMSTLPFSAADAFARLFPQGALWPAPPERGAVGPDVSPPVREPSEPERDIAELRREIEQLKRRLDDESR